MAASKWLQLPENRAKHDAYMRIYNKEYEKRPEVIARRKALYPKKKQALMDKYRTNSEFRAKLIKRVVIRKRKKLIEEAGREPPKLCEICNLPPKESRPWLVFDHCHDSEKFRGWICDNCNKALGHARDNPETLRKLAEYLEKFNAV